MAIIREATKEDFKQWLALRRTLWVYHTRGVLTSEMKDLYKAQLDGKKMNYLAIDDEGNVVGFAEFSTHTQAPGCRGPHIGFMEGWLVKEGYRGQGIGRALVEKGEAWARSMGCDEMGSDTNLRLYPTSPACHAALGYRVATIVDNNDYHFHKRLYAEEEGATHLEHWKEPEYAKNGEVEAGELVVLASKCDAATEATYWVLAMQKPYLYFTCRREGELVGFVRVVSDGVSEAYVEDLMVAPTSRSIGIGSKLMTLALAELKQAGIPRISVSMREDSDEFYMKHNFRATLMGRLKM